MTMNREALADMLRAEDALEVFEDDRPTLPLLIAKTRDAEPFDSNDLVGELARRRGWMVPAYQMPPNNENDRIMRMLVKFNQTRELADALADDFSASIKYLRQRAAKKDVGPPTHTGHGY
jgi:glutamate/tyrosine decarboxylase-like PLP-dependent enzyme